MLRRVRAEWPVATASFLLILGATSLLASGALYGDAVGLAGLQQALRTAAPTDRSVIVRTTGRVEDVASIDAAASTELAALVGPSGGSVFRVLRSDAFAEPATDAPTTDLSMLASYEGIEAHATLVDGAWPKAGQLAVEAVLSEPAAAALGLEVGDQITLQSRGSSGVSTVLSVVGRYRIDRTDPYWTDDTLEIDGVDDAGSFNLHGPFVIDRADLIDNKLGGFFDLQWRAIPNIDGIQLDDTIALARAIDALDNRLSPALPIGRALRVSSSLPDILDSVSRSVLVSRSGVLLVTLQFAILAAYALVLVAGIVLDHRRTETALLRARGAGGSNLAAMALGEAIVLVVPAVILAPVIATAIVALLVALGPLGAAGLTPNVGVSSGVIVVSALAGLACIAGLLLPVLMSGASLSAVRAAAARSPTRTLGQRLGLDLALVVVAGIGVWQLRLYGAPLTKDARGALGLDPILIATPAIGLLAGSVLATRVIPRLGEVAERVLDRRRGLVGALGGRQLARRPLRATRSALLLILAAALGTFASAHAATWTRSQADQAIYQAAADIRLVGPSEQLPDWAVGPAVRALDGVTAAMPVEHEPLDVGRAVRNGNLLAVDPATAASLIRFADPATGAAATALLGELEANRPRVAAVPLDAETHRLSVRLDAAFEAPADAPPGWIADGSIRASVILADADGHLIRLTSTVGDVTSLGQRLVLDLPQTALGQRPAGPYLLHALEIAIDAPDGGTIHGSANVLGVDASPSDAGDADWAPTAYVPGAATWTWSRSDFADLRLYRPPSEDRPGELVAIEGDNASHEIFGAPGDPGAIFRSQPTPATTALPAIVSTAFLTATGSQVGDEIETSVRARRTTLQIVGAVETFPPLDPAIAFAVVDIRALDIVRFGQTSQLPAVPEWWLSVDPSKETQAATALRNAPFVPDAVVVRTELASALATDPVQLGLIGALGLGAVAAVAFAAIGFVVSAALAASERVGEFALLRALGLSARQLSGWLTLESAALLVVGLAVGGGLGLGMAWLVLPFATLTATGALPVPTPQVIVPWEALTPGVWLALGLLVVTVFIVRRELLRVHLSDVLRARDE